MTDEPTAPAPSVTELSIAFLEEMVVEARKRNKRWAAVTKQSPQLDSGYLAQHLVSLLSGIPGDNRRGKGLDLSDGSEVKCASVVDGVDIPRWNHNFSKPEKVNVWLGVPFVFYVLFDLVDPKGEQIQVRMWAVTPTVDEVYQAVLSSWRDIPERSTNFQLHPPVNRNSNIATNECGNLELPLVFHAVEGAEGKVTVLHLDLNSPLNCKAQERSAGSSTSKVGRKKTNPTLELPNADKSD